MKKLWPLFILGVLMLVSQNSYAASGQPLPKGYCPVMPGERVNKKFYVDYDGRRIYLCCRPCVKKFKKTPEKYLAMLEEEHTPS